MTFASRCVVLLVLALGFTACSADEPKSSDESNRDTPSPTASTTIDGHPRFEPTDYNYVLTVSCYCPVTVPVRVTVEDGAVTGAVALERAATIRKGDPAPESLHVTINDIIDQANDPRAASVDVDWPDGQDWPSRVRIDRIEGATDDEIVYVLSDVRVKG